MPGNAALRIKHAEILCGVNKAKGTLIYLKNAMIAEIVKSEFARLISPSNLVEVSLDKALNQVNS